MTDQATNGFPFTVTEREFQERLITIADHIILASGYLPGLPQPQGWQTDAGHILIQKDELALQTHGFELLLNDLLEEPDGCRQLVIRLRDLLHQTNYGPYPEPTPEEAAAFAADLVEGQRLLGKHHGRSTSKEQTL